ncbi:MAG: glycosyltransferase family 8 protein [Oscillospiraceae bacterium]
MNVVYSSSDSYAPIAGVSMYSLLVNNACVEELNIYLIDNHISGENKTKFCDMCSRFGRQLQFIPMDKLNELVDDGVDIGRWNISTFARLFEASLLPETVKKVIHIDCDTMILGSLEPLWEIDMEGRIVAGAYDRIGEKFKEELGLTPQDIYINAGNILLDLDEIRKQGMEQSFKSYIHEHSHLSFVDQAVLNACVPNEKKLLLPLKYNLYSLVYYLKYENLCRVKRCKLYYTEEEVRQALDDPCIVHFTTCFMDGTRPWIENNRHPMLNRYLEYKSASPWADEPLWQDERGALKKVMYLLIRTLPQSAVCGVVGLVHNHIIPTLNKRKKTV